MRQHYPYLIMIFKYILKGLQIHIMLVTTFFEELLAWDANLDSTSI